MGDTVTDTAVDTDTVDTVDSTEASVPLMLSPRLMRPLSLNPKLKPMPTTAMATPTLTDTVTTEASVPLKPSPTTDTVDTTVDTTAVDTDTGATAMAVDTDTTDKLLFRIKSLDIFQIWRILTTNSFSLFPSLQHLLVYICYVLVSVES